MLIFFHGSFAFSFPVSIAWILALHDVAVVILIWYFLLRGLVMLLSSVKHQYVWKASATWLWWKFCARHNAYQKSPVQL